MTEKRWGMPKPKVKKSRPVVNKMGECVRCIPHVGTTGGRKVACNRSVEI
ncbi:hypothetical protein Esi_0085_0069 [Ectocarpus siliculosus]|uniref:Uncharacterized protein n=1 Tax=Ectocarpus siliculosus TaxID=2880 RepID=D7G7T0_ECTSI|nr:hypothetical protein Esi_0085_0069 [Ectocarpus siliculosus]|eukprot:CBJ27811.1 hypothetical protein Esi_0085_0069 [Ectocarpus siliculosus]